MKKIIYLFLMFLTFVSCSEDEEREFYACGEYDFSISGFVNVDGDKRVEITPISGTMSVYEQDGNHNGDLRFVLKTVGGEAYSTTGCITSDKVFYINKFSANIHAGNDIFHCLVQCQGTVDDKCTMSGNAALTGYNLETGDNVYSGITSFVAQKK